MIVYAPQEVVHVRVDRVARQGEDRSWVAQAPQLLGGGGAVAAGHDGVHEDRGVALTAVAPVVRLAHFALNKQMEEGEKEVRRDRFQVRP